MVTAKHKPASRYAVLRNQLEQSTTAYRVKLDQNRFTDDIR